MLPGLVEEAVDRYLESVDRALPGRLEGFYLVGSTALGAFQAHRSDIDFVAIAGSRLDARELGKLEAVQAKLYRHALARSALHVPWRWPLVCNGVFVQWEDLAIPPGKVTPIAAHSAGRFVAGRGFDVNPVTWRILGSRGIAVRGPEPRQLEVYHDDFELRRWTRGNLDSHWRRWAESLASGGFPAATALLSHYVARGVLGAARMDFTIRTGDVASKEQAGRHALGVSDPKWHHLVRATLAYWLGEHRKIAYRTPTTRRRDTAQFVMTIVDSTSGDGQR